LELSPSHIGEWWNTRVLTQCLTSQQSTISAVTDAGFAVPLWLGETTAQVIDKWWGNKRVRAHFSLTRRKLPSRRYKQWNCEHSLAFLSSLLRAKVDLEGRFFFGSLLHYVSLLRSGNAKPFSRVLHLSFPAVATK
jgi:hypothetical protein